MPSLPPENARKTHCDAGHPLAGDNLVVLARSDGRTERVCRACARRRSREHFRRHYVPHPHVAKPKPEPKGRPSRPTYLRILDRTEIIENGCWLWQGALTPGGYGIVQLGRGKGTTRVHRVIYAHFVGPLVPGLDVMHTCHVRNCVNPAHLALGTRAENMSMSQSAGRLRRHDSAARTKTVP